MNNDKNPSNLNRLMTDKRNDDQNERPDDYLQPDAPTMSDRATNVANENLTQSALADGEVQPEFGDAADPTTEELSTDHRDD